MRETKFRAWDKDYKEMLDNIIIYQGEVYKNIMPVAVSPLNAELMQYTGLKDKNGKEIYEGDIIRRRWLKGEEVRYVEEVIIFDIGAFWCNLKGGCCGELLGSHLTRVIPSQIEVIGNIYDNPELLIKP